MARTDIVMDDIEVRWVEAEHARIKKAAPSGMSDYAGELDIEYGVGVANLCVDRARLFLDKRTRELVSAIQTFDDTLEAKNLIFNAGRIWSSAVVDCIDAIKMCETARLKVCARSILDDTESTGIVLVAGLDVHLKRAYQALENIAAKVTTARNGINLDTWLDCECGLLDDTVNVGLNAITDACINRKLSNAYRIKLKGATHTLVPKASRRKKRIVRERVDVGV